MSGEYDVFKHIKARTNVKRVIVGAIGDYMPNQPEIPPHPSLLNEPPIPEGVSSFMDVLQLGKTYRPIPLDIHQDLALLQYTSGTTGKPKGAMITHLNLIVNVKAAATWWRIQSGEVFLSVLPLFHVTGLVHCLCTPLYTLGKIILFTRYETETAVQAIQTYQVNHWSSIATMNIAMVNHEGIEKYDLSSLTMIKSGGATIPSETIKKIKELTGLDLMSGFGLSETISQVTMTLKHRYKLGSTGIPQMDVDLKIVDPTDPSKELPLGEVGEILIKGPQVMKGYWDNPEATQEAFHNEYFITGDFGYLDEDGYLFISGRKKELIKASGYSVFPAEVENYLYENAAIHECCVYGVPDPYRGEQICAAVVLKPEYKGRVTEDELVNWAREHMAAYKAPRVIILQDSLPKNASGKILRRVVVEKLTPPEVG
jgi:acyl-CoA synthetase (AMP-forming)/AMP-acid ligase II